MSVEETRIAVSRGISDVATMLDYAIESNCHQRFPYLLVALHDGNQGHHLATAPTKACIAGIHDLLKRWEKPSELVNAADVPMPLVSLHILMPQLPPYVMKAFELIAGKRIDFMVVVFTDLGPMYISSLNSREIAGKLLLEFADAWAQGECDKPAHMH